MHSRRKMLALLALAAAIPRLAAAQRAARPARVGWLSYLAPPDAGLDLLRSGLNALGYVEGANYVIVTRFANNEWTRLPALVEELGNERLDVLVTRGPSTDFTKTLRSRVPVVFAFSGDPVAAGFGDSLAKPGRNMTGVTFMAMQLAAKRMEVLRELLPNATRIALLSNPEHAGELSEYRVTDETALRLGMKVTRHLVRGPQELPGAYAAIQASQPDAMLVFPDSLTLARRQDIAGFAAQAKIPGMYGWTEFVEAGGLIAYGPALRDGLGMLAGFVDKLLKGADANSLPIEQVSKIALTINDKAVKALGLKPPPSLMMRTDQVVE
jgi:putative tryptophan/tyrosine transport system substrate-binding protein